ITEEFAKTQADLITASATPNMLLVLRIGMVIVPVVLMIIGYFICKKKYALTEEKYDEICEELKSREETK
ncbi:MAG: hypothetical protein RR458_05210, partial [Clostridia bacterium]